MPQHFHFEENVKSHKTFSIWNWARHGCMMPYMSSAQDQGNIEGPKYETAFSTVFRAACRWTDLKVSKHLDRWLAITNKELFTVEVHHYRSCYHTYTLWVGSVTSWVVNLKHCLRQQKDNSTKNSLQYSHLKQTPVKSTSITNDKHCIMINHSMFSHCISLVNDLTN